jgi:hypothetical protein
MLRTQNKSSHLFYLQPYFYKLFHAIKYIYQTTIKPKKVNFVCYRGGIIN